MCPTSLFQYDFVFKTSNIDIGQPIKDQNISVITGEESKMAFFEKTAAMDVSAIARNRKIIPLLVMNFITVLYSLPPL